MITVFSKLGEKKKDTEKTTSSTINSTEAKSGDLPTKYKKMQVFDGIGT